MLSNDSAPPNFPLDTIFNVLNLKTSLSNLILNQFLLLTWLIADRVALETALPSVFEKASCKKDYIRTLAFYPVLRHS